MLNESDKANFETLRQAIKSQDACLLEAKRKSDGKKVSLVCAVNREKNADGEEEFVMVPLAVMVEGNPYADFFPPNPEGDECFEGNDEPEPSSIDTLTLDEMCDRARDDYQAFLPLFNKGTKKT